MQKCSLNLNGIQPKDLNIVFPSQGWLLATIPPPNPQDFVNLIQTVDNWCRQEFGVNGDRWYRMPQSMSIIWRFRSEEDRVLFYLTWG